MYERKSRVIPILERTRSRGFVQVGVTCIAIKVLKQRCPSRTAGPTSKAAG